MTDLDTLARHHADVLHESVADAERPELTTPLQAHHSRRGVLVAAAAAVIAFVVIAPFAWRPAQDSSTPQTTSSTPVTTTSVAVTSTSQVSTQTVFDVQRFAQAMLDGAFGDDEARIGMVVVVPEGTDISGLLEQLPELEDYRLVPTESLTEFASEYAQQRRMAPLDGSWQAYGLIPEYAGTPVWEWESSIRSIPDAVFATNLDFENPQIRFPDGWSILTELGSDIGDGALLVATNDGFVIMTSSATTIVSPDGTTRQGEPSSAPIPESCCGDAVAYSYGDGVLLLYRGEGAWLLDPVTVTWREIDPLPSDAYPVGTVLYPLGTAQIDGELYVVARAPRTVNTTSEVAALNLQTGTWRIVVPVPAAITIGGVTTDGTRLIVAGTHQDNFNRVIGGRNPAPYAYTDSDGWSQLPLTPIDGQASTITWIDNVGLLAWNYDLESALLDDTGVWRRLDDVPMDSGECLPTSVPIGNGAAGYCGGLAWFNGETQTWETIDAPRNAHFALGDNAAYAIVTNMGNTTVLQYPLPPTN